MDIAEPRPRTDLKFRLLGVSGGSRAVFSEGIKGNPLEAYPELVRDELPFNEWLARTLLFPVLERWSTHEKPRAALTEAVMTDIESASARARLAFQEVLPAAVRLGEPAVLAAMGVTANLLRTLAVLGEFMLGQVAAADPHFRLSRHWCGLTHYPHDCDYFTARVKRPVPSGRLRAYKRDPRHLRNALWCSSATIDTQCSESLENLKAVIKGMGLFHSDDLRHLHASAMPEAIRSQRTSKAARV